MSALGVSFSGGVGLGFAGEEAGWTSLWGYGQCRVAEVLAYQGHVYEAYFLLALRATSQEHIMGVSRAPSSPHPKAEMFQIPWNMPCINRPSCVLGHSNHKVC